MHFCIMQQNMTPLIAKHLRDFYLGTNWATSGLLPVLKDVDVAMANATVNGCNTIAALSYHINYYVAAVAKVLEGEALVAKDADSFNHPAYHTEAEWQAFIQQAELDANRFASALEKLSDDILITPFTDQKYGNYFRNLHGIIEHCHYHLGQIVILKKMLSNQ